jgi:hypothetical protein
MLISIVSIPKYLWVDRITYLEAARDTSTAIRFSSVSRLIRTMQTS